MYVYMGWGRGGLNPSGKCPLRIILVWFLWPLSLYTVHIACILLYTVVVLLVMAIQFMVRVQNLLYSAVFYTRSAVYGSCSYALLYESRTYSSTPSLQRAKYRDVL